MEFFPNIALIVEVIHPRDAVIIATTLNIRAINAPLVTATACGTVATKLLAKKQDNNRLKSKIIVSL